MATTQVATGSTLNVLRVQEKLISYMAERENLLAPFIGESMESAIQRVTELEKVKGDTLRVHLGTKLLDEGVTDDNPLEGNEESLTYHQASLVINQLRHGVRLDGQMTEQRSAINLRKDAATRLGIWSREVLTEMMMFYLSGARGVRAGHILPTTWTGHAGNALDIPDQYHVLVAGAAPDTALATAKTSMTATDKMAPALLTRTVRQIRLLINTTAAMRPLKVKGKNFFVAFMPPEHIYDLRSHADWINAQKDANVRGDENPLFSGAEGLWQGLIIHENPACVLFSDYGAGANINAARTVIVGAQALLLGYGNSGGTDAGEGRWKYVEKDTFDYNNQVGFAVSSILGMKKTRFDSKDYGVFSVDAAYTA